MQSEKAERMERRWGCFSGSLATSTHTWPEGSLNPNSIPTSHLLPPTVPSGTQAAVLRANVRSNGVAPGCRPWATMRVGRANRKCRDSWRDPEKKALFLSEQRTLSLHSDLGPEGPGHGVDTWEVSSTEVRVPADTLHGKVALPSGEAVREELPFCGETRSPGHFRSHQLLHA